MLSSTLKKEKSAGFLIFRYDDGVRRYLFLKNKGRYDVPKGLKMPTEEEFAAALRELKEETGIVNPEVVPGFKKTKHYFYKWDNALVSKEVTYFLAESASPDITISDEHDGYSWLTKEEAFSEIKYKTLREVIQDAEAVLTAPTVK